MNPRWLSTLMIGTLLLYAPLAFGCIEGIHRRVLIGGLFLCGLAHLVFNWRDGRRFFSRIPRSALVFIAFINLYGLVSALNAAYVYVRDLEAFEATGSSLALLPATYDPASTWQELALVCALSIGALVALDVLGDRKKRAFLLAAMSAAGLAVAVIGIVQKATGTDTMLWWDEPSSGFNFFAAFRYHGNAAAFLNLALPASLALLVRALQREGRPFSKALWANASLLIFAALFVNQSKFGHLIALPALCWAILVFRPRLVGVFPAAGPSVVAGAVVISLCLLLIGILGMDRVFQAWERATAGSGTPATIAGRLDAYRVCLVMIAAEPAFGIGPGAFKGAFPYFVLTLEAEISPGLWNYAHQDYLQLMVEWGLIVTAAWFALLGTAAAAGIRSRRMGHFDWARDAALVALPVLAVHALIDFPMQIPALQLYAVIYLAALLRNRDETTAG